MTEPSPDILSSAAEADRARLCRDIRALGIQRGEMLYLSVAMREVGRIEGGARTLLEAMLEAVGEEGPVASNA